MQGYVTGNMVEVDVNVARMSCHIMPCHIVVDTLYLLLHRRQTKVVDGLPLIQMFERGDGSLCSMVYLHVVTGRLTCVLLFPVDKSQKGRRRWTDLMLDGFPEQQPLRQLNLQHPIYHARLDLKLNQATTVTIPMAGGQGGSGGYAPLT